MVWIDLGSAVLLLLAGLPRLTSRSPGRRAVAVALCASAVVVALSAADIRALLWSPGLASSAVLAQCLGATIAAAALFAAVRRISIAGSGVLQWSPVAIGLPIVLLQGVLFYTAGGADLDGSSFFARASPEAMALWFVTVSGPVAVGVVFLLLVYQYAPGIARRWIRVAVHGVGGCVLVLDVVAVVVTAGFVVAWSGPDESVADTINGAVSVGGSVATAALSVVAVILLVLRAATNLNPLSAWLYAHWSLYRLDRLARVLVATVPEWSRERGLLDRHSVRHPARQLYPRVIAIRDMSWTLLGRVDTPLIVEACRYATAVYPTHHEDAVTALAEACWLRVAVVRPHAEIESDVEYIEHGSGDQVSLRDDVTFLVAVERAWRGPHARRFSTRIVA